MPASATVRNAPDFTLPSVNGAKVNLREALKNGPVLAVFYKVTCPTCQYTFPYLERIFQKYKAHGVQIWGIAQDPAEAARRFARQYGATFPMLVDAEPYLASKAYSVKFVPTFALVTGDGVLHSLFDGFSKPDILALDQFYAQHYALQPTPLFSPDERVVEFKPG
jgi:peroxiredoxin